MSYNNTRHHLDWTLISGGVQCREIDEVVSRIIFETSGMLFRKSGLETGPGLVTWYNWESHMLKISERVPNVLFTLTGYGEERGDIWRAHFLGGKTTGKKQAQIIFEPLDMLKLSIGAVKPENLVAYHE